MSRFPCLLPRSLLATARPLAAGLWCLAASAARAYAQTADAPPAGYYANAVGQTGATLRATLHTTIRGHTVLPYTGATPDVWDALDVLDEDPANPANVLLLYSGASRAKSLKDNGTNTQNWWNREHTWALAHGPDTTGTTAGTDLFHLFACDKTVNANRGNLPFDDVAFTPDPEAPLSGSNGSAWEPRDADKGVIARALLYMAIRYESSDDVSGVGDLELAETAGATTMGRRSTLLAWHRAFPATAAERQRNHTIYTTYQHNRNPFIDVPELADLVFVAGATPASAWRGVRFTAAEVNNAAVSGDAADPDADGLPNLLENLLHTPPKRADASPFVFAGWAAGTPTPQFELRHRRHRFATDLTLTYETSTDLLTWTTATPNSTSTAYLDAATDLRTVRFTANTAGGQRFYVRLRVTR